VPDYEKARMDNLKAEVENELLKEVKSEIRLHGLNPFQRRLVYEMAVVHFPDVAVKKAFEKENEVTKVERST